MTERELFLAAMEREDPAERASYLGEICGDDVTLRHRVESLLHSHEEAPDFMDLPVVEQLGSHGGGLEFLAPSEKQGAIGRLDQYEVLGVVGRGGMGIVFRAFDTKLQRVVALKALVPELASNPTARQRFVREARAAAAVTHDHIIAIHSVEDAGTVPYLVMQFIDGPTLQKKLERIGQLPLKEILRIGLQIAEGLAAAHRQGLIHRDIKPANILMENGIERVKITDFGLARASDDASLSHSGVVTGTPMYMSPEQADGLPVNFRSDLFSLGSVLYTICTGRPPFRAPTSMAVLKRVCEETPRPIREINPELPPWLERVVTRLHSKVPADRFASAREVADLMAKGLAELQHGGTPQTITHPASVSLSAQVLPPRSRSPWVISAAVLLALFAGLGLSEATGITNVRGTIVRLFSPEGTLVMEIDDPAVSISLNGEELVITGTGIREVRLKPGQYEMKATKEGKLLRKELVTVTRDGRQVVRVSRDPARIVDNSADTEVWEKAVAALPALEQVNAVAARLKHLNPGFNGKVTHSLTGEVVTGLQLSTDQVTNIMPVRVLKELQFLDVSGTEGTVRVLSNQQVRTVAGTQGKLSDLSPLKGLSLSRLICNRTRVSDLSPLQGMPLALLACGLTDVSNLSPLTGMSLKQLFCGGCSQLSDLTPLKKMPLNNLDISGSAVSDLSLLQGMPLRELNLHDSIRIVDLSPLKGLPLELLNIGKLSIDNLSVLEGMTTLQTLILGSTQVTTLSQLTHLRLRSLGIQNTRITDLSPLKGMPLKYLWLDYQPQRDEQVLRSLKYLEQVNGKPAEVFWKENEK